MKTKGKVFAVTDNSLYFIFPLFALEKYQFFTENGLIDPQIGIHDLCRHTQILDVGYFDGRQNCKKNLFLATEQPNPQIILQKVNILKIMCLFI